MPVNLNPNEKAAFIALTQAAPYPGGPFEAERLQDILNTYDDIYTAIMRQLTLFNTNNAYLTEAMAIFNDTLLQSVGIWNNKTISSPPLTDPVLITNSTITDWPVLITASSPPISQYLAILGNSRISEVTVTSYANLLELYIGPSVIVDLADATQPGALINTIWLPYEKSQPSRLNAAVYNSRINEFKIDEGSFFGGYTNDDPDATCASVVTDLAVAYFTRNTVQLTWTPPSLQSPPASYLFINTYYRTKGSNVWILAGDDIGYFNGDSGFTFTQLERGTKYEVEVIVTCLNGGLSDPAMIDVDTSCCEVSPP